MCRNHGEHSMRASFAVMTAMTTFGLLDAGQQRLVVITDVSPDMLQVSIIPPFRHRRLSGVSSASRCRGLWRTGQYSKPLTPWLATAGSSISADRRVSE